MITLSDYLEEELVAFLDVSTSDEAIVALIDVLDAAGKLKDKDDFYHEVLEREMTVSTAISNGVAIPHAKLSCYDDFFVAIGIVKNGVNWNAFDGIPVQLIFMVGGPDDKQMHYLQLLSALTLAVKDKDMREKIVALSSPEDIVEVLIQEEEEDYGS